MTFSTRRLSLLAVPLLLVGCSSASKSADSAARAGSTAASSMSAGQPMPAGQTMAAAAVPTATAKMVCGEDIMGKVVQVLKLTKKPATTTTWANQLYTCTYALPMGPMVLSVKQSKTSAAAKAYFTSLRSTLGPTESLVGLGEGAYRTTTGIAVVVKDNMTLKVDTTRLPAVFGPEDQKRTDLSNQIASDVLGCWTGDE
ncbi:hypothetical protein [Jatrophihabitans lederbergiae]|uniref:DUF3558 domain-containing protein n=1 Tax=Jatrophihabitans lederbergiae TaxID=3075547 RepID=A0ABU2J7H2_9ACTN|nr:hypothetical protein [Jatrophihabitans sp. DSM 44399]MDT0260574.1 hypothetical protein [Jatrophihabitans sp. DSM 44399]